jgi:hypothetical protein
MDYPNITTVFVGFVTLVGLLGIDWLVRGITYATASAKHSKSNIAPLVGESGFKRAA